MQDPGLTISNPERVGAVVGSGIGGITTWEREFIKLQEEPKRVVLSLSDDVNKFGGWGNCYKVRDKRIPMEQYRRVLQVPMQCDAYRLLQTGFADVMIGGSSESALTLLAVTGFANMKALSTRNDNPERPLSGSSFLVESAFRSGKPVTARRVKADLLLPAITTSAKPV